MATVYILIVYWTPFIDPIHNFIILVADHLHSVFGYRGLHPSLLSSFPPSSLLSHLRTSSPPSFIPTSSSCEESNPFQPFVNFQNSLKIKKKKTSRLARGSLESGLQPKRRSREGTTTYLWEFLLKLLQVKGAHKISGNYGDPVSV